MLDWLSPWAVIPVVLALYTWWSREWKAPLKKSFNNKGKAFNSHRKKMFPPPFPNGWYRVANACDLPPGTVLPLRMWGKDFVVFRQSVSKQAALLDAYCPHVGAHFGDGGTVSGDCLRCPFHGWEFDISGQCTKIPYAAETATIPKNAKVRSYHVVEQHNMVFAWLDAEEREPLYELRPWQHLENMVHYGASALDFNQHICEMAENAPDHVHFNQLHAPVPWPIFMRPFLSIRHTLYTYWSEKEDEGHIEMFDDHASVYLFNLWKIPLTWPPTHVTFEGPAIVHFEIPTPFGRVHMFKTQQPIGPFEQHTQDRWFAESSVPRLVVWVLRNVAKEALEQDRQVWESKTYNRRPVLVSADGPYGKHRRWWKQFYSDNSEVVSEECLDW